MEARECLHRHLGNISAYLPRYYPPQFVHYLKTYGRGVSSRRALDLPAEVESLFFVVNARRVFKLA
jgi:hypothetical protein